MNKISVKIGFWSAMCLAGTLVVYTIAMQILVVSKPGQWHNIRIYSQQITENWHFWLTICHVMVFLAAPLYLVLITCLHNDAAKEHKVFTRIAMNFATILTVLSSINYFLQFSLVKRAISKGALAGLTPFVQLNPSSVAFALATLGWTLFLGLSSLFVFPIFKGSFLNRMIRFAFIANAIFCITGFFGYIFNISLLYLLYLIGMGISMLAFSFSMVLFFKKRIKED